MKILFLVPYPKGESPSQRFRFEQYFDLLSKNNIAFRISSFWSLRAWNILYRNGHVLEKSFWLLAGFVKREIDLLRAINHDLIFIHRECAPVGPPIFEFIIAKILRKKIIYDFDDAIWLENTSQENKLARWIKFHRKVKFICRWSWKVSCGNAWLADYAKQFNSNVVLNPTTVDTDNWHNPDRWPTVQKAGKTVIGWTGTHSTISYLNEILPVLRSIEKKYPVIIRVISNKNPEIGLNSTEFVPWKKKNEITDLLTFDIGIMPLTNDEWAKGKCGFKALQYMALRIPSVASAVGVNTSVIDRDINGFLCTTKSEWEQSLEKLILDPSLQKKIGEEARKKIIKNYSLGSNSTTFLSLTKL